MPLRDASCSRAIWTAIPAVLLIYGLTEVVGAFSLIDWQPSLGSMVDGRLRLRASARLSMGGRSSRPPNTLASQEVWA